jgi:hypothetical protein
LICFPLRLVIAAVFYIKIENMAYPEGNEFWKLRSKHGRDKIFKSPEAMLEACYEYFEHQSSQSWNRIDFKGKDVEKVKIPTPSPFTIGGLCIFLGVNSKYFNKFKDNLDRSKQIDDDFYHTITHVQECIFKQKFEGALVGAYNPMLVARYLGISDKQEVTARVEVSETDGMTTEEIKAEIERLRK